MSTNDIQGFGMNLRRPIFAAVMLSVLIYGSDSLRAARAPKTQLPVAPEEFVRAVVRNELKEGMDSSSLFAFRQQTDKPRGSTVKQMVETPDGVIGRVLFRDGRPLSPEDRKKEDDRINRLLDPGQMREKKKEQKEDEERTRSMVRALPDAFLYKYQGTEPGKNGLELVRLHFTPNPKFDPPTRETLVFEGMEGDMWVDPQAMRIAKIDGTTVRDIGIGWGIIGHLDKGGRFIVEQSEVYKGHWDTTKLSLDFTGRALIFKSIRIKSTDTLTDFHPVPKMTVAEALGYLRKIEEQQGAAEAMNAPR